LAKSGSFGFAEGSDLCVGAKPNVPLVRLAKMFLKNVRWKKIKIQKRWLLGWLSDGFFVQSLVYVLFCRSFLLCRSEKWHITFRGYPKFGTFTTELNPEH